MKNNEIKTAESLSISDLKKHPVWEFVNIDEIGETAVRPIKKLPSKSTVGRLIGVEVVLANGVKQWSMLGNVKSANPTLNQHFITLSVLRQGKWFHLSRYHDIEYSKFGPSKLAAFLHLNVDEVFPISYDITHLVEGDSAVLIGKILEEPKEKLSRAQIIGLAVP